MCTPTLRSQLRTSEGHQWIQGHNMASSPQPNTVPQSPNQAAGQVPHEVSILRAEPLCTLVSAPVAWAEHSTDPCEVYHWLQRGGRTEQGEQRMAPSSQRQLPNPERAGRIQR
mmetsp:Transcript_79623/g.234170  ORF Transcript_79623/g.234170 Transcript_79623/m.234170 type:complete len:113 (+) Transcript_79623:182-520(+)